MNNFLKFLLNNLELIFQHDLIANTTIQPNMLVCNR